ncbi:hypothetical protein MUP79_02110 [Candidatus Bathyarchaeota archaeon]|nr:hypothetical protein [Candidatus Bathyarchaeota archaeon]
MGTSSNNPSPKTPNWKLARALLGEPSIPASRQAQELWRSASAERRDFLIDTLGSPIIASACELASRSESPEQAISQFESVIVSSYSANLALDLAKRALARAVAARTGSQGFASELFAEVIGYYASRDLPSFVAAAGRVETTSAAIALKKDMMTFARDTAAQRAPGTDPNGWKSYVKQTVDSLQKEEN